MLDVNGPSRGAIYYSSVTTAGATIIASSNFGTYYDILGGSATYNIALSNPMNASNIGKYYVFRNNTANNIILQPTSVSGGSYPSFTGIISGGGGTQGGTFQVSTTQSVTFVVATTTTYALF